MVAARWPHDRFLITPMTPDLAANTALSFSTTTTWQAYGGETTLRYLVQVVGLVSQNFLAGAAGLAVGVAFIRGFARELSATLGNFWVDLVRALLWVLLPLSLVGSLVLVWQGVPLNTAPYVVSRTLLTPLVVTLLTAWAVATGAGRAGLVTNDGSRGFTEVLFAYASCMANNGQTMAGLNANSPFYNLTTSVAMAAGRFGLAALVLVLAGRFAAQARKLETAGSMPCDTPTFGVLVLGSVVLVGALSFLPALALGPIAEHLHP